jgi:hypothetical protein
MTPEDQLRAAFAKLQGDIATTVAGLPAHEQFLRSYMGQEPSATAVRT